MIESTRLCPRCLQSLSLQAASGGLSPYYLCGSCGWSTDDESATKPTDSLSPFELPRYVRSLREPPDERPRAAGE